ncbi:hypothetical protein NKG94_23595 [Micromonospora sp. M12]
MHVTQVTTDPDTARRWFDVFEGAGLDGLIVKPADLPYEPGKRLMFRSSTPAPPTRWSPASAGTSPARWWARCYSVSTTTPGSCTTWV